MRNPRASGPRGRREPPGRRAENVGHAGGVACRPSRVPMRLRRRQAPRPDRSNDDWLAALQADGPELEAALDDLRPILLKALRITIAPRVDRGADALAEDIVQDALLHVRERADQFRGDARFTTWAQKVAVRLAFSELRRKRWEDVPLDDLVAAPRPPRSPAPTRPSNRPRRSRWSAT